jgi:hypothetical protein
MDVQNLQKRKDLEKNVVDLYLEALKTFNEWQRIQSNKNQEKSEEEKKKSQEEMAKDATNAVDLINTRSYVKNIGEIVKKKVELQQKYDDEKKEIIFSHKRIICLMMDFIELCIKHSAYVMKGLMGEGDESLSQHPLHDCKFFSTNDETKEVEEVDMLNYQNIELTEVEKLYYTLEEAMEYYSSRQRDRIMELNEVEKLFDEKTLTPILQK